MSEPGSELDPVGKLAESFLARYRRGERPALTEYTSQHPELAEQILEVFPALVMIEELGSVGGVEAHAPADRREGSAVPRQLGEYRILREVGRGGMGVVYEAAQESLGRHVALKVFPGHGLLSPAHLERFRREAKAAAQLHHTNIVPVFGVGEHEGVHFYAMQFIRGQGLDSILKELQRLRTQQVTNIPDGSKQNDDSAAARLLGGHWPRLEASTDALATAGKSGARSASPGSRPELSGQSSIEYFRSVARMGVQVAEALAHAHQQGILHRDIKPSNLLLDTQGTVWVTDFGLAKTEGTEELTPTGDIVGTLRYMAPERFNGWSDPRSDVYGLGITLYEMLTLRPAFQEAQRQRLMSQVLHDEPPQPRKLDPHIPRDLETIVLKAIAKEAGDRYQSAEALADDLRRFLEDRTIQARRSSASERTWRWCRRNPVVASMGAALAGILSVGVISLTVLYWNADAQRRRAEEAETNWKTAAAQAGERETQAQKAEADSRAVLSFFQQHVLAAAGLKGQQGGLGREATIREAVDRAEPGIAQAFAEQPLVEASIRESLGFTYWYLADYKRSIAQHQRALELRRAHLPPAHPDTLKSLAGLAQAYQGAGLTNEALQLHEETFKLRKTHLGPTDPETLWTMNRLAMTLCTYGRFAQALPLLEEGLKLANTGLGAEHPDTLIYMDCLATGYRASGRVTEAVRLFEQTLQSEQKVLGPAHVDTLATMNNLGIAYYDAGRFTEAGALLEETLKQRTSILGPHHSETLNTMNGLAAVYRDAGRNADALPLAEEALKRETEQGGPEHPYTLFFTVNLATTYRDAGRLDEAARLYRRVLQLLKAKLGADSFRRLSALNEFAACLLSMKRFDEALQVIRECHELRTRQDAAGWWLSQTKCQLGQALAGRQQDAEAEALLLEAYHELTARKETIPGRHRHFVNDSATALADFYEARGKKARAAEWRQKLPAANQSTP